MNYYRFPDRETFLALAEAEGLIATNSNGDQELISYGENHAIDEIGPIIQGGTWGANGSLITPPTVVPGHHVNVIGLAPEAWSSFVVVVNTPARVFLGGPPSP